LNERKGKTGKNQKRKKRGGAKERETGKRQEKKGGKERSMLVADPPPISIYVSVFQPFCCRGTLRKREGHSRNPMHWSVSPATYANDSKFARIINRRGW